MTFLNTSHKKRSFTITTVLLIGVLILMFYLGLSYMIPPPETGISINFGTENVGSGNAKLRKKIKTTPKKTPVQSKTSEETVANKKVEKVLTNNTTDAPVIPEKKTKTPPKKEKTPSKATKDALSNFLNSPKAEGQTNETTGTTNRSGNQGARGGDPYANSYYGSPGSTGTGVSYGLKGRNLRSRGKVAQDCNEEGRVVVKIEVDTNGKVIRAEPGVKGTTNNHPCLLEPAKKTAMLYRWNFDSKAPSRQIGFVVINFNLGE